MKKLFALTLVTGMALTLAACDFGKKAPEQPVGNDISNETLATDPGNAVDNDAIANDTAPESNTADGNAQ